MALHDALINVQSALKAPKSQTNTFGKYNYRSCEDILEAVKPLLKANGLTLHLTDSVEMIGSRIYIKATATITDGTDKRESTAFAREPETKKGMDESQITGTASSYARKYALNGLFCIDDTKDADTDAYETQTQGTPVQKSLDFVPHCTDCGRLIEPHGKRTEQQMAETTKERFGRVLCLSCASDEAARRKAAS